MLDSLWSELFTLLAPARHVLLVSHVRPDGDALGSEIAFAELLTQLGKTSTIYNPSSTPSRYAFLDDDPPRLLGQVDGQGEPPRAPDALVILDTGSRSQLAGLVGYIDGLTCPKAVVDHHVTQDDLGALRLVDVTAPACGMMVLRAFDAFKVPLTPRAAQALFVAVAMDTGWMRHPSTNPAVFEAMARFTAAGAKPNEVYRRLYETNSKQRLKLLGRMLGNLQLHAEGRISTATVTLAEIAAAEAHPMDTEDFIDPLTSIVGVEAALLFIEQKGGGTKVSARSRGGLDCSALTSLYGGGGHKAAAGAQTTMSIIEAPAVVIPEAIRRLAAATSP
ncbi:MAG: DHH family phosphoesterase [Planctomycetia bacterium]